MRNVVRGFFWFVLATAACGSTSVLSVWRDPAIQRLSFKKIVVFAPNKDSALRRTAEDAMVAQIRSAHAVPSYTILPEVTDQGIFREEVEKRGFDGAIVMRVVSVNREATWVPGMWTGPVYAGYGWSSYDPGYMQINTYVRVETNVYSVPDQRLVFASATRTVDPSSVNSLVKQTANAVRGEMQKQGMIQ